MKKNVKFCSGFSIAEMLIALLITMLIATALVPIIGPKKILNYDLRQSHHGIAECYWDHETNQLMYYYADNDEHKDTDKQITENVTDKGYCTFDVPKGSSFDIYAISAGASGSELTSEMLFWLTVNHDTTERANGTISMNVIDYSTGDTSYQDDLGLNIRTLLGSDNDTLIPDKVFDEVVRDSINRWAAMINHGWDGMSNVDDGEEEFEEYNPYGEYLYAEFKGLRGPIGAGGAGISHIYKLAEYDADNVPCSTRCREGEYGKAFCPESTASDTEKFTYEQRAEAIKSAHVDNDDNNGICKYYHLHERGGDSAPAFGVDSGASVLFPIDAASIPNLKRGQIPYYSNDNKFVEGLGSTKTDWPLAVNIQGSQFASGFNNIQIYPSAPGTNAVRAVKDGAFILSPGEDGDEFDPVYSHRSYTFTPDMPQVKYLPSPESEPEEFNLSDHIIGTDFQSGSKHGLVSTAKGQYYPSSENENGITVTVGGKIVSSNLGEYGRFGLSDPLFKWSFRVPTVQVRYYPAGKAGNMQQWTFLHLKGPLYLKPGKNDGGEAVSDTSVYTDSSNPLGSAIITVPSPANNDVSEIRESDVFLFSDIGEGNYLPKNIMNEVIPENNKFEAYKKALASVRKYGFNGGLLTQCGSLDTKECLTKKYWPGYGGAGAFPVFYDYGFENNTLILENNQDYATTLYSEDDIRRKYIRNFPIDFTHMDSCPEGYIDPNADVEGGGEPVQHYCVAEGDMRRNGAVIIVW